MVCNKVNCSYRTRDCLDDTLRDTCRLYHQWKYESDIRAESLAELERMHQENDIHLAHLINNQQVRESSNASQRLDSANRSFPPSLIPVGRGSKVETSPSSVQEVWHEGKDV